MNNLLKSGTVLQSRYRILRVIDQGGMGAVYLAENLRLFNKVCAVKEMLDNFSTPAERQEGIRQFEQEAKILSSLRHSNLPIVQDYFSESTRYYLVMDYIKGRTLESLVETTPDFLPESVVLKWCASVCNILEYLHAQRPPIIFRDLNPRNIMVEDGTGEVKLIDFGIARLFKAGKSSDTLSLGSPGYCPIEQYGRGQTDARSDVYTLGATMYHLLTKKVPVAAVERIKPTPALLQSPRQINRRLSPEVEQVILKAMEISPDKRFQTVAEMRQALSHPQAQASAAPRPAPPPPRQQPAAQPPPRPQSKTIPKSAPQPPSRPRSHGMLWFILLFIISAALANWLNDWQNRRSGADARPRGARKLDVPGSATDRVSLITGDRTDWWRMDVDHPCTLKVTVIPLDAAGRVRLAVYADNGRTVLDKGTVRANQAEAIVAADSQHPLLAQVMAPRLWDWTRYTIKTEFTHERPTGLSTALLLSRSPSVPQPGSNTTPEGAQPLAVGTAVQGSLDPSRGHGTTWWRVRVPTTGTLTVMLNPGTPSPVALAVYGPDGAARLTPSASRTPGNVTVSVLGPENYYIKVSAQGAGEAGPYTITTRFFDDPETFSGPDRAPAGANDLPLQESVHDTVAYAQGDRTDWWRMEFPASGRLTVDLRADSPDAVRMRVYRAVAVRQRQPDDYGLPLKEIQGNDEVSVEGKAGTVYYAAVSGDRPTDASRYELSADFEIDPEANSGQDAQPAGARPLPLNGNGRGSVDYGRGDRSDWWRVVLPGKGTLTVTLTGYRASADLQLELYDRTGTARLGESTADRSSREELSLDLEDGGPYLVKVYADASDDASPYELSTWYTVDPEARSGLDATETGATELRLGKPVTGSVDYDAGDRTDWWKVRVPAAGTLTVELKGAQFMMDLDLKVYDSAASAVLAESLARRSSRERVSIPVKTAGWYSIEVYANEPGDSSGYTLTAAFTPGKNK
ncbi:MAG: protein kinase [Candidatus Latescibacteria bacterium]|nr:protein kinase [Candidatus Latescibacterota bacterium]